MKKNLKGAYRHLLYWAMLDIRQLNQPRKPVSLNPLEWKRGYEAGRMAGIIADWLHNLAYYSARDFVGFDEVWFWKEYEGVLNRHRRLKSLYVETLERYRSEFQWAADKFEDED
jgi:hypothetical protein